MRTERPVRLFRFENVIPTRVWREWRSWPSNVTRLSDRRHKDEQGKKSSKKKKEEKKTDRLTESYRN